MKKQWILLIVLSLTMAAGCAQPPPGDNGASGSNAQSSQTASTSQTTDEAWTPTKEITFIVPFDAGGASDIPARILAKYMSKYSTQPVTVVNLPGSSGRIGMEEAYKAAPDGHTVVSIPTGWFMMYALDIVDKTYTDYEPITLWADSYMALAVNSKSDYGTYEDFLSGAKEQPGNVKLGSLAGTLPRLACMSIMGNEGVEFNLVDLDGGSKATELLGMRIDGYVDAFAALESYVRSGDFNVLGVFSDTPLVGYEDIPTMKDLGMEANMDYLSQRYALWAPKGTPANAVEYIGNLVKQASEDPACIEEISKLYYSVRYMPTEEYIPYLERVQKDTVEAVKPLIGS